MRIFKTHIISALASAPGLLQVTTSTSNLPSLRICVDGAAQSCPSTSIQGYPQSSLLAGEVRALDSSLGCCGAMSSPSSSPPSSVTSRGPLSTANVPTALPEMSLSTSTLFLPNPSHDLPSINLSAPNWSKSWTTPNIKASVSASAAQLPDKTSSSPRRFNIPSLPLLLTLTFTLFCQTSLASQESEELFAPGPGPVFLWPNSTPRTINMPSFLLNVAAAVAIFCQIASASAPTESWMNIAPVGTPQPGQPIPCVFNAPPGSPVCVGNAPPDYPSPDPSSNSAKPTTTLEVPATAVLMHHPQMSSNNANTRSHSPRVRKRIPLWLCLVCLLWSIYHSLGTGKDVDTVKEEKKKRKGEGKGRSMRRKKAMRYRTREM